MPRKTEQRKAFNCLLNVDEYKMLEELAGQEGVSLGAAVRVAIRVRHQMKVHGVPRCGDGSPCFVPQMHTMRQQAANGGA